MSGQVMIGDRVRRTDEDWGEGNVIGVMVKPDLTIDFRVSWPDGPVVGWVHEDRLERISEKAGTE